MNSRLSEATDLQSDDEDNSGEPIDEKFTTIRSMIANTDPLEIESQETFSFTFTYRINYSACRILHIEVENKFSGSNR